MRFFSLVLLVLFFFLLVDLFFFRAGKHVSDDLTARQPDNLENRNTEPEELGLEEIFNPYYNPANLLQNDRVVTLLATGDVMLGRSVNVRTIAADDFAYPYQNTKEVLSGADITLVNLEGPLVENCPTITSGFTFCGDIKHAEGLTSAGIDVVNTANNHILNFGNAGLETTNKVVAEHGITLSNSAGPNYLNVKGTRFAFLGSNDLDYPTSIDLEKEKQLLKTQITQARQNANFVVVSIHWGNEYQSHPSARQQELAHFAIDSGADLVVGNHPHWIQPVEVYHGKIITYSHGNFVFDQTWSEKTKEGVAGKYTFFENKIIDVDFLPVYIEKIGQPKIVNDERGRRILEEMKKYSYLLQGI